MADITELKRQITTLNEEISDLKEARYTLSFEAGAYIQKINSLKTVFSSILSTLSDTEDTVFNQAISGIISNANDNVIGSSIEKVKAKVSDTLKNIDSAIDSKQKTLNGYNEEYAKLGGV